MSFKDLGLSEKVLSAVTAAGYETPTPIQEQAIPVVLEQRDVVGIAQTGTGKTAAFVLPMLTRLESGRARARMPRTLILEPTRELAAQVEENFDKYGINHKLNVALLIGGVSFGDQNKKLDRGVDVLIATPGRLLDHCERGRLLMTGVEILVIDEADRMLDMGFIPDIERICKMIPAAKRQTLMFSATMPPEIQRLGDLFLKDPARVEVARPASTASNVTQRLVASGPEAQSKRDVLRDLVRGAEDLKNAIVFCNRKRDVQVVYRSLEKHGFNVGTLHGDLDQRQRMATLEAFRAGRITLLVASDVAARGLDIPDVSHVFNYDVPIHAEDYVHRIGRTARAGRAGTAIAIVTREDAKHLAAIEKLIGQSIEWMGPSIDDVRDEDGGERRREGRDGHGRRGGRGGRGERAERGEAGERPARGERSERPARGERPERTARPERDETAERPARGERSERGERPERTARPERDETSERPARSERSERGERPERTARPERDETAERPARSERPARGERPERGEHPERSERSSERRERGGRHEPEERPVVGLGDHVPAFLLRPTRPAPKG
jgi:superfamily II DNA/RNA helicase